MKEFKIITTQFLENPYWQYNNLLTKEEVISFFNKKADNKTIDKVEYYILAYVENIIYGRIMFFGTGLWEGDIVLLKFLRKMYKKLKRENDLEKKYNIVWKMIRKGLEYGFDPF